MALLEPVYQGHFYKFSGSYLKTIPIRLPSASSSADAIWGELGELQNHLLNNRQGHLVHELERRIDKKVFELFQVNDSELEAVIELVSLLP